MVRWCSPVQQLYTDTNGKLNHHILYHHVPNNCRIPSSKNPRIPIIPNTNKQWRIKRSTIWTVPCRSFCISPHFVCCRWPLRGRFVAMERHRTLTLDSLVALASLCAALLPARVSFIGVRTCFVFVLVVGQGNWKGPCLPSLPG